MTDLVGAIIAVFVMAIAYEGLKTLREYLLFLDMKRSRQPDQNGHNSLQLLDNTKLILAERQPINNKTNKGLAIHGRGGAVCR